MEQEQCAVAGQNLSHNGNLALNDVAKSLPEATHPEDFRESIFQKALEVKG